MNALVEEIRIALHAVWRRRWFALAVAWAIALAGWLGVSLIPNVYESTARIYVEPQSILPAAVGISPGDTAQGIDAVRQTLLSSDSLQAVVKDTDLAKQAGTPADMNAMIARLQKAISIKSSQDNLFDISADLSGGGFSDAQKAKLTQQIVGKLLDLFVNNSNAGNAAEAARSLKFLDQQLSERGRQLQVAEQKQQDFEQKFMGMLPGTGSIDDRIAAGRSQLQDVESNLAAAQASMSALSSEMASTPATIAGAGGDNSGSARGRIATLQAQLAADRAQGWTDQHPDVVALNNQIARLQSVAAGEPVNAGGVSNPAYSSLRAMAAEKQATVAALSARRAQLQSDISNFVAKQVGQPEVATQQAQLARDHDVLQSAYDKLLSDREQVKLRADAQSAGGGAQFHLVAPPSYSKVPAKPMRPLLLTGVLIAALGGGIGAAFLRAKLQTSYSTPAALAAASGLPVLGGISYVRGGKQKAAEVQQLKWFAGAGGALVGAWVLLIGVEFVSRGLMA